LRRIGWRRKVRCWFRRTRSDSGSGSPNSYTSRTRRWRRGWDSNPRYLAVRLISSQVHSTTLPPLHSSPVAARYRRRYPGSATPIRCPVPSAIRRRSGWSLGPWPQMPMYLPTWRGSLDRHREQLLDGRVALVEQAWPRCSESRSRPSVSWVRSLEPIEKPSKMSRNSSASRALDGHFAHHDDLQVVLARLRPFFAEHLDDLAAFAACARTES
jgi:hypothetical protein